MSVQLLYCLGTLAILAGWGFAVACVWSLVRADRGTASVARGRVLAFGAIAALLLFAGTSVPALREGAKAGTWRLPVIWPVMPFPVWATLVCGIVALARLTQSTQALTSQERKGHLGSAVVWLAFGGLFGWWIANTSDTKVTILTGGISLGTSTGVGVLVLALAAMAAMGLAARSTAAKGWAMGAVNQAALIAGSIVFGLPFAFLLVTSLKEDRDMSSPTGIVWVPKVTQTVPYFDKKNPLYETDFEGQTIQGSIIGELGDGRVRIDVQRPFSIRGVTFEVERTRLKEVPRPSNVVTGTLDGKPVRGILVENLEDGRQRVELTEPATWKGREHVFLATETEPVREVGLNWKNYPEALSFLPPETRNGLVYLRNTLVIVLLSVLGTILSSSIVSYAFSRLKFPARSQLFALLLATMMLPGAVTLLPQFLIFRSLGWIDTLYPLWVPAFFASAFNVFLLRQFFLNIPMELEDAAKIDGCSYLKTFWSIMLPQIKPALAVIFIWTFLGTWNNFMGPLIYINSPENMPLSYALQLFAGDRSQEPGYLMAFATLTMLPVLAIFFFFQRYFIEGVTLSGLGGR